MQINEEKQMEKFERQIFHQDKKKFKLWKMIELYENNSSDTIYYTYLAVNQNIFIEWFLQIDLFFD